MNSLLFVTCSISVHNAITTAYIMRMNPGPNIEPCRAGVADGIEVPPDALRILARLIARRNLSGKRERDAQDSQKQGAQDGKRATPVIKGEE